MNIQTINLDIVNPVQTPPPAVTVKQGDSKSRQVIAKIYEAGVFSSTLNAPCRVYFEGIIGNASVYIDGEIASGVCTFTIPYDALKSAGTISAEIQILNSTDSDYILSTMGFFVDIKRSVSSNDVALGNDGKTLDIIVADSIKTHNTDTTSHQDIRETINTLGSIHVPELIKSHNTDLEAHSDIRADIQTLGNTVIPNMAKSAAADAVNEHNYNATAHEDIRQQRNADMDNLSANIIPGIASAKVQAHNTDETAHSDIREKIAALESDSVPEYWQVELDNKVMLIRETLGVAGQNKSAFLWYTDAHWNKNYGKSPILLKYLYNNTPLNKTNFGGDIVQDEPDDDTIDDCIEMSYLHEWRKLVKDINHHSVVGNHDDGSVVNNRFSQEYIYSYLLAYEECPEMHIGDGLYYYIDDSCEKTRYLYLDTAYQTSNDNQSQFIVDTLLSTPKDWHVVVIAHIWHDAMWTEEQGDYIGDYSAIASKFLSLLYDYNHRASGNIKVSSTSIEYDFTDCGGKVEFCIGGHAHWDHISYYNDEIPVILTETDSYRCRVNYTATQGTTTENAVNAIIADYTNKTIHVIRVGRGEDIEVSIKSTTAVTYTNVLASAISLDDMTSVLTGDDGSVGFLNNKRWSNSAASYIDLNGWDTSGAIPCKAGDVIRLKNITMYPYSDSSSYGNQGYINFYSSEGTFVNSTSLYNSDGVLPSDFAAEYDESGNIIQFTIPSWNNLINDMAYFSIACQDINENSVITINEELE